jgi:hypothetical protein
MREDSSPVAVEQLPEPPPPPKRRRRPEDMDDDLDPATYSFDKEYAKRTKRIQELRLEARRQNVLFFSAMFLFWIGLGLLAYFLPDWAIIPWGCGAFLSFIGWIWLLVLA